MRNVRTTASLATLIGASLSLIVAAPAMADSGSGSTSAGSTPTPTPAVTDHSAKPPTDTSAPPVTETPAPTPTPVTETPVTVTPPATTPVTEAPATTTTTPTEVPKDNCTSATAKVQCLPGIVDVPSAPAAANPVGSGAALPFTGPGDVVLAIVIALLAGSGGILFLMGASGREQLDGLNRRGMDSPSGFQLAYRQLRKDQVER